MAFLLDTCVLSEAWKPRPNGGVVDWLGAAIEEDLFLSALSLGELVKGIERLAPGKKQDLLRRDYGLLRGRFSSRVLAVTEAVAERWGALDADATRRGLPLHVVDGLLAATALASGLTLVTRNVRDFAAVPVPLVDPWT
jgi:predicted nucleic acid-binding protein